MSHSEFADVWSVLHGRSDIDNILRELIGRYSLDVSLYKTEHQRLRKEAFRHVVAVKVILDLQRTYLQSSRPSLESKYSLIHHELVFSTILHLLEVKTEVYSSYNSSLPDHAPFWALLSQTLLSGLRVLHLQRHSLSPEDYRKLQIRFNEVRNSEALTGSEDLVVNHLCTSIIQDVITPSQDSRLSEPACGVVELPDFFTGLFPIEKREGVMSIAAQRAKFTSLESANWFRNALILYDLNWSTIAAFIQLCMDVKRRKSAGQWTLPMEAVRLNDLHSILTTRFKMQSKIYGNILSSDEETIGLDERMKRLLCLDLVPACVRDQCVCLGDDRYAVQSMRLQHGGQEVSTEMERHFPSTKFWNGDSAILTDLKSTLDNRRSALTDGNGELSGLLERISEFTQEWCPESSYSDNYGSKTSTIPDDFYVVNCPNLHPIPAKDVYAALVDDPVSTQRPKPNAPFLRNEPAQFNCHQCNRQFDLVSARKIEPLSKILAYIRQHIDSVGHIKAEKAQHFRTLSTTSKPANGLLSRTSTKRRNEVAVSPRSNSYTIESPVPALPRLPSQAELQVSHTSSPPPPPPPPTSNPAINKEIYGSANEPHTKTTGPTETIEAETTVVERLPSTLEFNADIEAKQRNLITEDRRPSHAPSYTELHSPEPSIHHLQRSPITSGTSSPLAQPNQIERNDFPELYNIDPNNFPQVVEQQPSFNPGPRSIASQDSDVTSGRFVRDGASQKPKKWQSFFKGGRSNLPPSAIPSATFFSGGRSLLLWNDTGAGCYDLHNAESIGFRQINARHVRIAAGGSLKCALVTKNGSTYALKIFEGNCDVPLREIPLEGSPHAMALSRSDQFLALKFSRYVQVFDTITGGFFYHELPRQNNRSGRGNHLVSFSNDSQHVIASTRYEPEKVITYWSECTTPSRSNSIETSAPFGLVGDDGLSSLLYSDAATRGAFLSTFTEQGYPVLLNLSDIKAESKTLRDPNGTIGSRIHRAAICPASTNLVFVNQRNDIFWMLQPFGQGVTARRIASIKRATSVKRDVEVGMSNSDEAHIFWIDKGRGQLMTIGRSGGKSKPLELTVDMDQLVG